MASVIRLNPGGTTAIEKIGWRLEQAKELATRLELPPIGWQLFMLDSSQSDSIAFPSCLDTYATRLLTEPLNGGGRTRWMRLVRRNGRGENEDGRLTCV